MTASKQQPTATGSARGGSHTDGGAFRFSVAAGDGGQQPAKLECVNKFGDSLRISGDQHHRMPGQIDARRASESFRTEWSNQAYHAYDDGGVKTFWDWVRPHVKEMTWDELGWSLDWMAEFAQNGDAEWRFSLGTLNLLHDIRYSTGEKEARLRFAPDRHIFTENLPHRTVIG